jgi:glucoamylase
LRLTERGNPDAGVPLEINSGGGRYDQREIVDAGFLELVRLGVKAKDNPLILRSLSVIDDQIRIATPFGPGWYRYNHDAYGERVDGGSYDGRTGKGRLWTFLSGERGEYESSRGNFREALRLLDAMLGFANDGLMIPEQVWDKNGPLMKLGKGTGSATPLAWSMAEFIRLALRIQTRRDTTTPAVVLQRYATRER